MARTKNRFMHDEEEENELEPGEALTGVTTPEPPKEEKEPEPQPSEPEKKEESAPVVDLLADLIPKKPKPKPETFGFYLDSDVHDELVRLAKANKTNKSKFLNALLRRVLFNE